MGSKPDAAHEKCVPACDASQGEYFTNNACQQCPKGSHVVYSNPAETSMGSCVADCSPGQVFVAGMFHLGIGTSSKTPDSCYTCPNNTYAVYDQTGASAGKCAACADYTVSAAGSLACMPLECGPNAYANTDDKHSCTTCPTGQIYYPAEIVAVPGANQNDKKVDKIPGHCGCPENTQQVGDTCQCPAGVIKAVGGAVGCMCPAGAHVDKASFSCQCAAGATLDSSGTKCECPQLLHIEGDKCVSLQIQRQAVLPENSGEAAKPVIRCPPRTAPNAAGTACLPQLDMPDFGAPGSLPSGLGRAAPARVPAGAPPGTGAAAPAGATSSVPPPTGR